MYPVERVKAALEFSNPDKVPIINWTTIDTILSKSDVFPFATAPSKDWQPGWADDEVGLFPHFDLPIGWKWNKPEWAKDPKYKKWRNMPRQEIDEWGCIWNRKVTSDGLGVTMGHPGRPSLPDWSKLDDYIDRYFPDPEEESRYQLLNVANEMFESKKYIAFTPLSLGPFAIASNMRGFNNFMIDHRRNPEKVEYLLEQITEIMIKIVKKMIRLGAKGHGFLLVDDLGSQSKPLIHPELFKDLYDSSYGHLIRTVHDLGLDFHQHCCGKIDQLIPTLIEWGLDALEFDSPRMCGYSDLKQFRGKIMFWGCVNIQSIYIRGSPEDCIREVWHMMRNLGTKNGGFGAYYYPQPEDILVPKENIKAFRNGLKQYGTYSSIPDHWWDSPTVNEWKINDEDYVPPLPSLEAD